MLGSSLTVSLARIPDARAEGLCGNGLVDRPQESCDPNASEYYGVAYDGCQAGQVCKGCRCLKPRKVLRLRPRRSSRPVATLPPGVAKKNPCGNGRRDAGEQCDTPKNVGQLSTQCYGRYDRQKKICTKKCKCVAPRCGDGYITKGVGEQCDPKARPVGCLENQLCTNMCRCIFKVTPIKPLGPIGR